MIHFLTNIYASFLSWLLIFAARRAKFECVILDSEEDGHINSILFGKDEPTLNTSIREYVEYLDNRTPED